MEKHIPSRLSDWWVLTDDDFPPCDNYYLQTLPTEVLVEIFCDLGSFFFVHRLAATCRRLQSVWSENTTTIYKRIAPIEIGCHRHARNLLADQGGSGPDSLVTVWDVRRMARNLAVVNQVMCYFNTHIIPQIRAKCSFHNFLPTRVQFYHFLNGRSGIRPQYLLPTERRRLTRCYYQMWGLLIQEPKDREHRLQSIARKLPKDLIIMQELSRIDLYLPRDAKLNDRFRDKPECSYPSIEALGERIRSVYHEINKHVYGLERRIYFYDMWCTDGARGQFFVFDYAQEILLEVVRGPRWRIHPACPPEWKDVDTDEDD